MLGHQFAYSVVLIHRVKEGQFGILLPDRDCPSIFLCAPVLKKPLSIILSKYEKSGECLEMFSILSG
jgi:hypothetical protein